MFQVELVEGKDQPQELGCKEFEEQVKTATNVQEFVEHMKSGDNGQLISVSTGILAMWEKGLFQQESVKPRGRWWPVLAPGKYIDKHFQEKIIGHCETLEQV
ncbi:hypothetical protein ACHAXS_003484, partial [Conticribra weissflogii]